MISLSYMDHLQKQNADDLAFYPLTSLQDALDRGRIISCVDNDEPAGYIWIGPIRAGYDIVIYQACVDYETRRHHLGHGMIHELISLGLARGGNGIRLRCASSSSANQFWQAIGFYCTRVTPSGIKRRREINHWRMDIQVPLFQVNAVIPSTKSIDTSLYDKEKRQGVNMSSRFTRNHY